MKSTNTATKSSSNQVSSILIDLGAMLFRPHQPFKYNTGIISPVYTDDRLILSNPKARNKILNLLVSEVKKIGLPDVIAGTATAGIPHAALVAGKLNLPMIYVRPQPKGYGRQNQIEGSLRRGQKVIVIDDHISTGRSSLDVVDVIRKAGGVVRDLVAITTYGLKSAENNFKKEKTNLHVLTDLDTSCDVAVKKGFLKQERVQLIKDWAKDPENWGK